MRGPMIIYGVVFVVAIALLGVLNAQPLQAMMVALMLIALEVSLSFDNAVINARVLRQMSPKWQKRFLLWGILVAVFGVRLLLPFLMVYWGSNLSFTQVLHYALHRPDLYHQALEHAFPYIAAFGSGFLMMVWLAFMQEKKQVLWIKWLDGWRGWQSCWLRWAIIVVVGAVYAYWLDNWLLAVLFYCAALLQFGLHTLSHRLSQQLSVVGKIGLAGFIYLEFLDASFSLDGVVGAFAITSDIAVIMVGLGCGALVMRSFTVYCVQHNVTQRWRYLEHGAHYALMVLAVILLLKAQVAIPEWITGGAALAIIGVSVATS